MIGSEAMAREILNFPFHAEVETYFNSWSDKMITNFHTDFSILPEGWTLAGAGTSRYAFRGPDGVIYKVPTHVLNFCEPSEWRISDNFSEAYIYMEFAAMVERETNGKVRMAESHYFYDLDIIAMEYSERVNDAPEDHKAMLKSLNMHGDLHDGNIWSDRRGTVMVDYGYVKAVYDQF